MKCEVCGKDNWHVLVIEYTNLYHRDGNMVLENTEIGKASVTYTCQTEKILGGGPCANVIDRTMNADEFEEFKKKYLEAK